MPIRYLHYTWSPSAFKVDSGVMSEVSTAATQPNSSLPEDDGVANRSSFRAAATAAAEPGDPLQARLTVSVLCTDYRARLLFLMPKVLCMFFLKFASPSRSAS